MADVRTRAYRSGRLVVEDFALGEISAYLDQPDSVLWVDLSSPSPATLAELAAELGVHELAVEDVLEPHQRPKVDRYSDHLFLSCHAVRVPADGTGLEVSEIDVIVHERFLVTVHSDPSFDMERVIRRWDRSPDLAGNGVSFLLHGLLDVVVDEYFTAVDAFDAFYDDVSEGIFSGRPLDPDQQRGWFEMRRALVRFHRLVGPMREVMSTLMRRENLAVSDDLYPYYEDVYDHLLRVGESTESLRDLVSTIVETNLSLRDYDQNQVMKQVTSWAAIIAVPTLITGYYGMNVPYAGSGSSAGAWVSTLLIVVLSAGLYRSFRRRGWL